MQKAIDAGDQLERSEAQLAPSREVAGQTKLLSDIVIEDRG